MMAGTDRLKLNPQLGRMPALQFALVGELQIDHTYQRSLETRASQTLVRRIAQFWNWDLCQPLMVSRRENDALFVIDGQHRLEAARLRGDIRELPCVILSYASVADEAASFVHLNQERRPLSKLEIFKSAVASGDSQATAIVAAMRDAGLEPAPHQNYATWKPGVISNIGGIERAWKSGPPVAARALAALGLGFSGQVLQYAGTIYPGLVAVCADEMKDGRKFAGARFESFTQMLWLRQQADWRKDILKAMAEDPGLFQSDAAAHVFRRAWYVHTSAPQPAPARPAPAPAKPVKLPPIPSKPTPPGLSAAFRPNEDGRAFCDQCDRLVTENTARGCRDKFCPLRLAA